MTQIQSLPHPASDKITYLSYEKGYDVVKS